MPAAQIVTKDKTIEVQEVQKPTPSAGEIVVKNEAVALNPTDWKHLALISQPGSWLGCDFAGTVDTVGEGVTNVKQGDRVAGFVYGGKGPEQGSFADYVKTEGTLVWKVPSSVSWEEAAALGGIGPHTAVQALYMRLKLPMPSQPSSKPTPVLVWGGSTSVGLYALQLLKASGLHPITTASPKNFDLVKSFGAADVFDYTDDGTPARIAASYPDLAAGLDTIAEKGTTAQAVLSFGEKGGHLITLLPTKPEQQGGRPEVKVEATLVYSVSGKEVNFGPSWVIPAMPEDRTAIEQWLNYVPSLIESGGLRSNPLWSQSGGLKAIPEGLALLREGKVSGQKVTYKL